MAPPLLTLIWGHAVPVGFARGCGPARRDAAADPEAFWADIARHYEWMSRDTVCDWEFDTPRVSWFDGAELNITANCLDRHVAAGHGDRTPSCGAQRSGDPKVSIPYAELLDRVCRFANVLKRVA